MSIKSIQIMCPPQPMVQCGGGADTSTAGPSPAWWC